MLRLEINSGVLPGRNQLSETRCCVFPFQTATYPYIIARFLRSVPAAFHHGGTETRSHSVHADERGKSGSPEYNSAVSFPYHLAIPAAGTVLAVLGAVARHFQRRISDRWPVTEAHVFQTIIDQNSKATWMCRVVYSYSLRGDYFSGEDERVFATESAAEKFEEQFPKNRKILIRYHPGNPELTMLREEDNSAYAVTSS
jgi:hypothetical protein